MAAELEQTGGVVSDLEQPNREESKPGGGNGYLYLTLGIGFVVAGIMVIATAGVPAAGVGFVIPAAIFLGLALKDFQKHRHVLPQPAKQRAGAPFSDQGQRRQHNARGGGYGDLAHRARG